MSIPSIAPCARVEPFERLAVAAVVALLWALPKASELMSHVALR
jgi:hypothetical protein